MIEVTITRQMLDTDLQSWFLNAKNAEHTEEENLAVFSEEPATDIPGVSRISGSNPERLLTAGTEFDSTEQRGKSPSALGGPHARDNGAESP